MRIETPKIVQPGKHGMLLWLVFPIALVLCGLLGWQFSAQSREHAMQALGELQGNMETQQQQLLKLRQERDDLRAQVVALQRSSQIDKEAARQIQLELGRAQQERKAMEEELDLLRHIVSTGVKSEVLFIQGFQLQQGAGDLEYRFQFTVSQALKSAGTAQGWIFLEVEGEQEGDAQSLLLKDISTEKSEKMKMRFRHFQDVDGQIRLPQGFVPKSVIVEVKPNGKKLSPVKKRFDWLIAG